MRHSRGRVIEVESGEEFDGRLEAGARSLSGWHVQGVDLSSRSSALAAVDVAGALFLGCRFADGDEDAVRARGAVVFPSIPGVPVDTYRTALYAPSDLYDAHGYEQTLDARAYAWSQQPPDPEQTLAAALHDHAIGEALSQWVADKRIVGVMGGHALERGTDGYRDAALLGHSLAASGLTVATGGGPGAMEAANLGAWLSPHPETTVGEALRLLAGVPSFRPDIKAWAGAAFDVRDRFPDGGASLGVPTWFYGHEPPNVFATDIAKFFANAPREAVLLEVCDAGIVFLPGAGGTVQEIFQDACENYYADESSVAPMVLVGHRHWTQDLPAWPLLQALARGRAMEPHVHLVDILEDAVDLLR